MKKTAFTLALAMFAASAGFADNANARNETIENAIKNRPELSEFYQGLINTGVIEELNSGVVYTVFAPTNAAFEKNMMKEKYPCFYSEQCKAEVADIMRNHIVAAKEVNFASPNQKSVFNLNRKEIILGEPSRNNYTADGHNVVAQNQLMGGIVHEIDGVIASPQQLVNVTNMKSNVALNKVERATVTERVFYAPDGAPDGTSKTTTVTTTTTKR